MEDWGWGQGESGANGNGGYGKWAGPEDGGANEVKAAEGGVANR